MNFTTKFNLKQLVYVVYIHSDSKKIKGRRIESIKVHHDESGTLISYFVDGAWVHETENDFTAIFGTAKDARKFVETLEEKFVEKEKNRIKEIIEHYEEKIAEFQRELAKID